MQTIKMVIVSCGDGSNNILWVKDYTVISRMEELADEGDEYYASGDGLQVRNLEFADDFDLQGWMKHNFITLTTLKEVE